MSGDAHNSWANAALESPGSALARAQQRRWALDTNDEILAKLNNKLAAMLEGISDATERQAQEQIRDSLLPSRRLTKSTFLFSYGPLPLPPNRQPGRGVNELLPQGC